MNNYENITTNQLVDTCEIFRARLCSLCGADLSARIDFEPMLELFSGTYEHIQVCSDCIESSEVNFSESLRDEFPEVNRNELTDSTLYSPPIPLCENCKIPLLTPIEITLCSYCAFDKLKGENYV